ncbi:MAG: FIST N-terminal domain-containing protein [Kiloniellales bacterium]
MKIVTAMSAEGDPRAALADIARQIETTEARGPDFIALHVNAAYDRTALQKAALSLGARALHGGSSCLGIMTEQGLSLGDDQGLGCFALWDEEGDYATGSAALSLGAAQAGAAAVSAALEAIGRVGEAPDLIWLTSVPGSEEEVIAGIETVVGAKVPIVGGSAADNDISAAWYTFDKEGAYGSAVVISVLFPSTDVSCAYSSGYTPTQTKGIATRVEGRELVEIDNKPAGDVYRRWTGGRIPAATPERQSILWKSTLAPLGRSTSSLGSVAFHLLAHPAALHADETLSLFANVQEGEEIVLMQGSEDSLVGRAGRIARMASGRNIHQDRRIEGALVVYCAGCMLAVRERMQEVADGINAALPGTPFLGIFTFGEQGSVVSGSNRHANLMISCVTFAA